MHCRVGALNSTALEHNKSSKQEKGGKGKEKKPQREKFKGKIGRKTLRKSKAKKHSGTVTSQADNDE